ncbi:MAG: tRNA nucleotidyltransferase, partial [Candidatus Omnitrophica bacterium]|nr:tRNA nucleotidyltransferase [Candidatus Omnitrophota bacterium]
HQAIDRLNRLEERIKEVNRKDRLSSFKLALNGYEIMEMLGITPGRIVGKIKEHLEQQVLDGLLRNNKRELRRYLKNHWREILH